MSNQNRKAGGPSHPSRINPLGMSHGVSRSLHDFGAPGGRDGAEGRSAAHAGGGAVLLTPGKIYTYIYIEKRCIYIYTHRHIYIYIYMYVSVYVYLICSPAKSE